MGDAFALPSDPKTFNPSGTPSIPVSAPQAPHLGKVFELAPPTIHRHPRPLPQVPVPESAYPPELSGNFSDPFAQAAPPAPPQKPPVVAAAAPAPEGPEERGKISADRLEFLKRVEALVGAESKINDLERENQALLSIVSRQQKELETLRRGAPKA